METNRNRPRGALTRTVALFCVGALASACTSAALIGDAGVETDGGGSPDAGASDGGVVDAGRAIDSGMRADGGPRDAGAQPGDAGDASLERDGGASCMDRCLPKARSCGAPATVARDECARICAASPRPDQLACLERLSCAAAACTHPGLPCGIGVTDTVPLDACESTCRATATRCGAPLDVAQARCASLCPLVTHPEQLACLRDGDCEVLGCIDAAGHHPCGIAAGAPR